MEIRTSRIERIREKNVNKRIPYTILHTWKPDVRSYVTMQNRVWERSPREPCPAVYLQAKGTREKRRKKKKKKWTTFDVAFVLRHQIPDQFPKAGQLEAINVPIDTIIAAQPTPASSY